MYIMYSSQGHSIPLPFYSITAVCMLFYPTYSTDILHILFILSIMSIHPITHTVYIYIYIYTHTYLQTPDSDIARPNSFIFLNSILLLLDLYVLLCIVKYYCTVGARNISLQPQ